MDVLRKIAENAQGNRFPLLDLNIAVIVSSKDFQGEDRCVFDDVFRFEILKITTESLASLYSSSALELYSGGVRFESPQGPNYANQSILRLSSKRMQG